MKTNRTAFGLLTVSAVMLSGTTLAQGYYGSPYQGIDAPTFTEGSDTSNYRPAFRGRSWQETQSGEQRHSRPSFSPEDVERSVEKISDGVIETITSDDEDIVEKLQNHEPPAPRDESLTVVKENITNGIRITKTSDDAQTVERLHERADNPRQGSGNGGHGHGQDGPKLMVPREDVTHTIEKIDDGIITAITSDDEEIVEKLQNFEPRSGYGEDNDLTVEKENITNGVRITKTSDDAETVERLHEKADRHAERESITRTVVNLSNGAMVDITSDLDSVVERLQSRELPPLPDGADVNAEQENIANGIRRTFTTENEDMVERIQERVARGPFYRFGGHKRQPHNGDDGSSSFRPQGRGQGFGSFRQGQQNQGGGFGLGQNRGQGQNFGFGGQGRGRGGWGGF